MHEDDDVETPGLGGDDESKAPNPETARPRKPRRRPRSESTFEKDEVCVLVAEVIERAPESTERFVPRDEIRDALLVHPVARPLIESAAAEQNAELEVVAGNMVDWWSAWWTMRTNPLAGRFERGKVARKSAYRLLPDVVGSSLGSPDVMTAVHEALLELGAAPVPYLANGALSVGQIQFCVEAPTTPWLGARLAVLVSYGDPDDDRIYRVVAEQCETLPSTWRSYVSYVDDDEVAVWMEVLFGPVLTPEVGSTAVAALMEALDLAEDLAAAIEDADDS